MKAARAHIMHCVSILAIVLTNVRFGLTIFGFAWTIVGCSPATVHVVSTDSAAFQQLLNVELAADARRPAHLMKQYVRDELPDKVGILDNDKLPEPYTQNEVDAVWPANYHLGYAARSLMRAFYAAAHPAHRVLEDGNLVEIVDEAGGNTYVLNDFDRDRQPDITNIERRFVFEIVPPGQAQRVAGKKKVDWNLLLINKAMIGVPTFTLGTGYAGEVGVRFAEGAPPWKLSWQTIEPGIISYQWQVLSVGDANEEVYGKAYLDNRWHDPTPNEMVRFARALHEVVERLVQAREELGQTRADTTMPILPGKTMADYLRSVVWWSAHDDKVAKLLPVMRQPPPPPPAQVRRDARLFGQTAQGGGGGDPPGGYTLKGRPGDMPWPLFMGHAAHNLIGKQYQTQHPGHDVFTNTVSIQKIVEAAGGIETLVRADEALKRPDITDVKDRVVFEIKSSTTGQLEEAKIIVARNITAINRAMPPADQFKHGTGFSGDFWVRFTLDMRWWRLKWSTTAPGVIQYNWSKLDNDQRDEAKVTKGIQEGRYTWVDLTEADMQQYAEKCAVFSERYVEGANILHAVTMVADVVVEILGSATMVYLSPGLGPGKMAQPGARPTVSRMAPSPPSPKRPPVVNAPPLGSDTATFTGSVHPTARPVAPGKTPSASTNVSPN